jgi:hypothetical protein
MLISCDNDDVSEPVPEPIIANAKMIRRGDCAIGHHYVQLYELDYNILPSTVTNDIFSIYNLSDEYRVDGLEINLIYRNLREEEKPFCMTFDIQPHEIYAIEVQLPTE